MKKIFKQITIFFTLSLFILIVFILINSYFKNSNSKTPTLSTDNDRIKITIDIPDELKSKLNGKNGKLFFTYTPTSELRSTTNKTTDIIEPISNPQFPYTLDMQNNFKEPALIKVAYWENAAPEGTDNLSGLFSKKRRSPPFSISVVMIPFIVSPLQAYSLNKLLLLFYKWPTDFIPGKSLEACRTNPKLNINFAFSKHINPQILENFFTNDIVVSLTNPFPVKDYNYLTLSRAVLKRGEKLFTIPYPDTQIAFFHKLQAKWLSHSEKTNYPKENKSLQFIPTNFEAANCSNLRDKKFFLLSETDITDDHKLLEEMRTHESIFHQPPTQNNKAK